VTVVGPPLPGGAYVLRIIVRQAARIRFGRFARGDAIHVSAGAYVYVGSARGDRGRPLLARLVRHAARSSGPPHLLWPCIARCPLLLVGGAALPGPRPKRLRWHVDYLLESPDAALTNVFACRTSSHIERDIARRLESDPLASPLSPGLGAGDDPGHSHLLRVDAGPAWWPDTVGALSAACENVG
jgi:Uri superfamily endonuclease